MITGTVDVGETLTADTSGIADANGLSNPGFTYQWVRNDGSNDEAIDGATCPTHTIASSDAGKSLEVTVSFTDDHGYAHSLTSNPMPPGRNRDGDRPHAVHELPEQRRLSGRHDHHLHFPIYRLVFLIRWEYPQPR